MPLASYSLDFKDRCLFRRDSDDYRSGPPVSTLMEEFLGIWARRARGRRTINTGQLRAWHPDSGKVEVLVDGLLIPDGVKSSAHEDFVAVNEFRPSASRATGSAGPRLERRTG